MAAFRWTTWVWMALVASMDASNQAMAHGWAALILIGSALVFTAWATVVVRTSSKTVGNHVRNILGKVHLNRKQELIRYALDHDVE